MSQSNDSPQPPGSPMRRDEAGEGLESGDLGVDRESPASDEDEHGGTIDEERHSSPPTEESAVERENAETSLDQPSEG
jgi:hypothetical protein